MSYYQCISHIVTLEWGTKYKPYKHQIQPKFYSAIATNCHGLVKPAAYLLQECIWINSHFKYYTFADICSM